jgi:hypothetical protein
MIVKIHIFLHGGNMCEVELPTQQARRTGDDEGWEVRATGLSLSRDGGLFWTFIIAGNTLRKLGVT